MVDLKKAFLVKIIGILLAIIAIGAGAAYAGSVVSRNNLISQDAAENFAIVDANVSRDNVSSLHSHLERDQGRYVYDVEFHVGDIEYEYEILAQDGSILEKRIDNEARNNGTLSNTFSGQRDLSSSEEKAKGKTEDQNVPSEGSSGIVERSDQDSSSGIVESSDQDSSSGIVESSDQDSSSGIVEGANQDSSSGIVEGADQGASDETASSDHGRAENVLSKTEQTDDSQKADASVTNHQEKDTVSGELTKKKTAAGDYIGVERAKQIALDDAGFSENEVIFSTAKFEKDDDDDDEAPEYEIEFFKGNVEYEYDIDALTGKILDFSSEIDDD